MRMLFCRQSNKETEDEMKHDKELNSMHGKKKLEETDKKNQKNILSGV